MVIVGMYNDYENNNYNYGRNIPATFVVAAGSAGGDGTRKNAIIVTKKGTINNIPNVGNVFDVESCVIMPEVGEHHNYGSDCAAATAGIPLYGLYHTNGALKIRVTECGSGNPPTTTTSTTPSGGPGLQTRFQITDCNNPNLTYYCPVNVYCSGNSFAITPGFAYSAMDVVQYRRNATSCTGATYCGTLSLTTQGLISAHVSSLTLPSSCSDNNVCSQ